MFLRLILWVIIGFILAKIIGSVLRAFREGLRGSKDASRIKERRQSDPYRDAEDADFEDITDKK